GARCRHGAVKRDAVGRIDRDGLGGDPCDATKLFELVTENAPRGWPVPTAPERLTAPDPAVSVKSLVVAVWLLTVARVSNVMLPPDELTIVAPLRITGE